MTQRDNHYKGVLDCISKVYKEDGAIGFSKGFHIRFISLGICGNVFFALYEVLKSQLLASKFVF